MQRLVAAAPQISIARVRGTLLGGVRARGRAHAHDARRARHRLARVSSGTRRPCSPACSRSTRADAARATYRRVPGVTTGGGGPPELPWPVRVDEGSVSTLSVTVAERTLVCSTRRRLRALYGGGRLELSDVAANVRRYVARRERLLRARGRHRARRRRRMVGARSPALPASGSVELTGTWPELRRSSRASDAVRRDDDGHARGGAVPRRRRQRVAEPRVAGRRRHREPERPARVRRRRSTSIATTAPARSTSSAAARASRPKAQAQRLAARARASSSSCPRRRAAARYAAPAPWTSRAAKRGLDVAASRFDPAWIAAAWAGRLDGTATLRAGLAPEPNAALEAIELAATLRGYPVTSGRRGVADGPRPRSARRAASRLRARTTSC